MTKNQVKMWVVGLLAGGSLLACSPKEIQTGNLNVIPLPQEITETADASPFVIRSSTTICYPSRKKLHCFGTGSVYSTKGRIYSEHYF